jgi:hypothetical protein
MKVVFALDVSLDVVKVVPVSLTDSVGHVFSLSGAIFVSIGLFVMVVAIAFAPFPSCPPAAVCTACAGLLVSTVRDTIVVRTNGKENRTQ